MEPDVLFLKEHFTKQWVYGNIATKHMFPCWYIYSVSHWAYPCILWWLLMTLCLFLYSARVLFDLGYFLFASNEHCRPIMWWYVTQFPTGHSPIYSRDPWWPCTYVPWIPQKLCLNLEILHCSSKQTLWTNHLLVCLLSFQLGLLLCTPWLMLNKHRIFIQQNLFFVLLFELGNYAISSKQIMVKPIIFWYV